jgi:rod shape-determining protein MreD
MTLLTLVFWLIAGGTLQVVVPAWRHMGQPAFPFLLGVVLFAAVNKKARYFVPTALLAGVVEDALSLAPLGYSACAFLAAGGLAMLLREDFFAERTLSVMGFGALCAATSTGTMALLLRMKGLVALSGGEIFWRMAGSAILGAVLIPLLFSWMRWLERRLGIRENRA